MIKLKHWVLERSLLISVVLLIGTMVAGLCVRRFHTMHFIVVAGGAVISLNYFMLQQHLAETRLFKELFAEFNGAYDKLSEDLNTLHITTKGLSEYTFESEKEKTLLYKYFNLCAEEYLYYRKGYIYPEVWSAWYHGMEVFYQNRHIWKFWEEERKTNSYYRFDPPAPASVVSNR